MMLEIAHSSEDYTHEYQWLKQPPYIFATVSDSSDQMDAADNNRRAEY